MKNQPTEKKQETKPIYYWLDGYWITDKEEAELMDEINAFGSTHGVVNVLASADNDSIDTAVQEHLNAGKVQYAPPKAKLFELTDCKSPTFSKSLLNASKTTLN